MIRICPDRDAQCPHGMGCDKPCAKETFPSEDDGHDAGALADHDEGFTDDGPTRRTLASAIQCWSITNLNARIRENGWKAATGPTLGEAALAFALPVERIKAAVEWHYWMFVTGDGADADLVIEHEGE